MRHLFQSWHDLVKRVREATEILLFLDYDGTLTPIAARPETAPLPSQSRELLRMISHNNRFKLAIISGRSLDDIKMLIGLENIAYAGNHGLEIECSPRYCQERSPETTTFVHPVAEQSRPAINRLEQKLKKSLAGIDGLVIENKGLTLSLHYRLAKTRAAKTIRTLFLEGLEDVETAGKLRVTEGKKVLEARPLVDWNKGQAVQWLVGALGTPGALPVFAGDDATDEDAFDILNGIGGISIFVGDATAPSSADYYLNCPDQLYHWLEKLLEQSQ